MLLKGISHKHITLYIPTHVFLQIKSLKKMKLFFHESLEHGTIKSRKLSTSNNQDTKIQNMKMISLIFKNAE